MIGDCDCNLAPITALTRGVSLYNELSQTGDESRGSVAVHVISHCTCFCLMSDLATSVPRSGNIFGGLAVQRTAFIPSDISYSFPN